MGSSWNFVGAPDVVRDRDAAIEFYERLLGAPPTMLPNDDEAAWQLTGGGWLYVLRDADRAGRAVVTLLVDDLYERLAALTAVGIELGPVETVAGSTRKTWITRRGLVRCGQREPLRSFARSRRRRSKRRTPITFIPASRIAIAARRIPQCIRQAYTVPRATPGQ